MATNDWVYADAPPPSPPPWERDYRKWVYENASSGVIAPRTQSSMNTPGNRPLAMVNWFKLEIEGELQHLGFWSQVSGLAVQWNMLEYRVGDQGNDRWYFPGVTTYSNIVMKRAACKDSRLVKKWLDRASFNHRTVNGKITLYAAEAPSSGPPGANTPPPVRPEIMSWELRRIMPLKWNIDGFDAGGNKVAIETLEVTHEGFLDDDHRPSA